MPPVVHDCEGREAERSIYRPVLDVLRTVEGRLLHLVGEVTRGTIPFEDFATELTLLSKSVQRCYQQLVELKERRDLSFGVIANLRDIDNYCVWLFRKIHVEQAFFKQLDLEARLRNLVSEEAFKTYLTLLHTDDEEREFRESDEEEIKALLLGHGNRS